MKYLIFLFLGFSVAYYVFRLVLLWIHKGLISGSFQCGRDTMSEVHQDKCPEYNIYENQRYGIIKGSRFLLLRCPYCQSMRLTDLYWYKTDQAAQGYAISANLSHVQNENFFGCLKCGKIFEYVEVVKSKHIGIISICVIFIFAIFRFDLEVVFVSTFMSLFPPKPIYIFIGLTLWFYLIMRRRKKMRVEEDLSLNLVER